MNLGLLSGALNKPVSKQASEYIPYDEVPYAKAKFGDTFGQRGDYSLGIVYGSRRKYLVEKGSNPVHPPPELQTREQARAAIHHKKIEKLVKERAAFCFGVSSKNDNEDSTTNTPKAGSGKGLMRLQTKTEGWKARRNMIVFDKYSSTLKKDWVIESMAGCTMYVNKGTAEVCTECPWGDDSSAKDQAIEPHPNPSTKVKFAFAAPSSSSSSSSSTSAPSAPSSSSSSGKDAGFGSTKIQVAGLGALSPAASRASDTFIASGLFGQNAAVPRKPILKVAATIEGGDIEGGGANSTPTAVTYIIGPLSPEKYPGRELDPSELGTGSLIYDNSALGDLFNTLDNWKGP